MKHYELTWNELCAALENILAAREGVPVAAADDDRPNDPKEEGIRVEVLPKPDDEG